MRVDTVMKRAAILFAMFIVVVIILANTGSMPRYIRMLYDFPYGDKVGHFVLFGLLNYFLVCGAIASFPRRSPGRITIVTCLILAVIIAAEEYSQNFLPRRSADWLDLAAGYLGVILGGLTAYKFRFQGRRERNP